MNKKVSIYKMIKKISTVQTSIVLCIILYAYLVRNERYGIIIGSTLVFAFSLLHLYDHLFLIRRGQERPVPQIGFLA